MRFTREEILPFSSAHSTKVLAGEATNNKINIPRKGCSVKFSHITYMMYMRIPCLHNLDGWRTLHGKQTLCCIILSQKLVILKCSSSSLDGIH